MAAYHTITGKKSFRSSTKPGPILSTLEESIHCEWRGCIIDPLNVSHARIVSETGSDPLLVRLV